MSEYPRIRRRQLLSEAEGYLDLITVFAEQWSPAPGVRDRLANRALAVLERLDEEDADQGHVMYLEGQVLRAMQRHSDALVPLCRAAQLDPGNLHIQLALGWCYKRVGQLNLAIQSLEEALEADTELGIVHYNLACYWSLGGNADLAVRYLAQAFDIDPKYRELVADETDFDPIRNHSEFQLLTAVIV